MVPIGYRPSARRSCDRYMPGSTSPCAVRSSRIADGNEIRQRGAQRGLSHRSSAGSGRPSCFRQIEHHRLERARFGEHPGAARRHRGAAHARSRPRRPVPPAIRRGSRRHARHGSASPHSRRPSRRYASRRSPRPPHCGRDEAGRSACPPPARARASARKRAGSRNCSTIIAITCVCRIVDQIRDIILDARSRPRCRSRPSIERPVAARSWSCRAPPPSRPIARRCRRAGRPARALRHLDEGQRDADRHN